MCPADAGPKSQKIRVLNLEDDPLDSELVQVQIEAEWGGVEFLRTDSREAFLQALEVFRPDVVVSDFNVVPGFGGKSALEIVRARHPEIPVIMVSGALTDVDAVALIKAGAADYVLKDNLTRLNSAIGLALSVEQGIRERKAMEAALKESEARYRALVETSSDVIWEADAELRYTYVSPRIREVLGYEPLELIGKSPLDLMPPHESHRIRGLLVSLDPSRTVIANVENINQHKDGHTVILETSGVRLFDDRGDIRGYRGVDRDITGRKETEARDRRLTQLYAALSQCNEHIMRCNSEQELFDLICRDTVLIGGLKMAWIGMVDSRSNMVQPVAHFGEGVEYLNDIQISVDAQSPYGRGPTGRALREDTVFWCQDFQHDPLTEPWHERGKCFGWGASAALPLHRNNAVAGVLTLYAGVANAFDEAERNLLQEIGTNLSFALDKFANAAERKLREDSLLKLLQAVEQSPNTIVITDLDANIEYANPAFTRATGYVLSEAVGQNPRILSSGKTPREVYDEMWGNLTQGKVWRGEFTNRRKDGSEYIEAVQISPVRQPDGRITNYLAIKEDITANKLMQQRIMRDSRRMKALLKINEVGGLLPEEEFLKFGLENAEQLTASQISFIHFVNEDEETIKLTVWSTATTGQHCKAGHSTHHPASQAGMWADSLRNKRAMIFNDYDGFERKHGLPEGHAALSRMMTVPVIEEGRVRMLLGVGNKQEEYGKDDLDVVQLVGSDLWRIVRRIRAERELKDALAEQRDLNVRLKSVQTQLIQSEKMASIGLLAAGVAHEINNPIGYVNSNLGTLEKYLSDIFTVMNKHDELCQLLNLDITEVAEIKKLEKKLDIGFLKQDIKSLLNESREGLERVKKIVLDLKNFSRSEAEEHWQWADIHAGLDSTLTIVWNELKYKCEVRKEYGQLPQIYCLPSQLSQVFMNLLVNAAQAIETRGVITIRTGSGNEQVWVEIIDTGSGIRADILPRIFDPFFTTKPVGSGTGLGLPVSYGIIERHHGRIEVSSEVGKGTIFRIQLPVKQPATKEKA